MSAVTCQLPFTFRHTTTYFPLSSTRPVDASIDISYDPISQAMSAAAATSTDAGVQTSDRYGKVRSEKGSIERSDRNVSE